MLYLNDETMKQMGSHHYFRMFPLDKLQYEFLIQQHGIIMLIWYLLTQQLRRR